MPVSNYLPYRTKQKQLPRIPGTNAVDLAPIAPARRVVIDDLSTLEQEHEPTYPERDERRPQRLDEFSRHNRNVNTGNERYEALAVRERLESRANRIQQPMLARADWIIREVMKEKKQWVDNDLGETIIVSLNGVQFQVDQGKSQQPRSVAIAFQERKNKLIQRKRIMREALSGRYRTVDEMPEPYQVRDNMEYYASENPDA